MGVRVDLDKCLHNKGETSYEITFDRMPIKLVNGKHEITCRWIGPHSKIELVKIRVKEKFGASVLLFYQGLIVKLLQLDFGSIRTRSNVSGN